MRGASQGGPHPHLRGQLPAAPCGRLGSNNGLSAEAPQVVWGIQWDSNKNYLTQAAFFSSPSTPSLALLFPPRPLFSFLLLSLSTEHKWSVSNHFSVHGWVILITLALVCSYHHHPPPDSCHLTKLKSEVAQPLPPLPQPLVSNPPPPPRPSISVDLTTPGPSCE